MEIENSSAGSGTPDANLLYARRRDSLRPLLRARGLDGLLVLQAPNRFYLSGFELHDPQPNESAGCLLVGADGEDWLATDARYLEAARSLWPEDRIFVYGSDPAADLKRLLSRRNSLAGIEAKGASHGFHARLQPESCRDARILCCDGLVEKLRIVKDQAELACLRQSFALNHKLLDWLENERLARPLPAVTESQLSWEVEKFLRENGARELAFASIIASGANAALPHAIPGDTVIAGNAILLADVGCRVHNYCSDQTRTFWLGANPDGRFTETMRLVREAQQVAIDMIRPGVRCADVYAAARSVFVKAGVEKAFSHGLGHGVGLETHEAPSLSPRSAAVLEKNMVVTVEPGLYYPGWGGIRWEYTVAVTENGAEIL